MSEDWISSDEAQHREVNQRENCLIEESRRIYSTRSQQGYITVQQSNDQALPSLVGLVRRGLGTYFEAGDTPTSARINGHQSTLPYAANNNNPDLPIYQE